MLTKIKLNQTTTVKTLQMKSNRKEKLLAGFYWMKQTLKLFSSVQYYVFNKLENRLFILLNTVN